MGWEPQSRSLTQVKVRAQCALPPPSSIPPHLWRPLRRGVAGDAPDYGQCGTLRGLPSHSACILCYVYCLILRYASILGQQCARKWDARHTMQCILCNAQYAMHTMHGLTCITSVDLTTTQTWPNMNQAWNTIGNFKCNCKSVFYFFLHL